MSLNCGHFHEMIICCSMNLSVNRQWNIKFVFGFWLPTFDRKMASTSHVCHRQGCRNISKNVCIRCDNALYCGDICARIHWNQIHKHVCYRWTEPSRTPSKAFRVEGMIVVETINSLSILSYPQLLWRHANRPISVSGSSAWAWASEDILGVSYFDDMLALSLFDLVL